MKKELKNSWIYILLISIVYFIVPWLLLILPFDDLTLKGLFISLIVLYQPLLIFVLCLHQAYKYGFTWWLPLLMGLLIWLADIVTYPNADGLDFYVIPYALVGYLGEAAGYGLQRVRNRKNK